MAIEINLDAMMAKREISSNELAAAIGRTLEKICEVLQCQPGDILCYKGGGEDE